MSAAPWGSASILAHLLGLHRADGRRRGCSTATQVAILNANYMADGSSRTTRSSTRGDRAAWPTSSSSTAGRFKKAGVEVEDIAKRLMDYGFHAPTMSWPVAGTLMIEPTESESKAELDRFCDAMIAIREEIRDVEEGRVMPRGEPAAARPAHRPGGDRGGVGPALHAASRPPSRPPWVEEAKFWPAVARIDNAWGDRNLVLRLPLGRGDGALAPRGHGRRDGLVGRSEALAPRSPRRRPPRAAPRAEARRGRPLLSGSSSFRRR